MLFPQALIRRESDDTLSAALCSPAFETGWHTRAVAVCAAFSADPPSNNLPATLFVQRLDRNHLMIVRTQAEAKASVGPSRFHLLIVSQRDYAALQCDPFAIADQVAPNWTAAHELPDFEWQGPTPPRRSIADVQQVLKGQNGPELLGGCQALIDGSQLLFLRSEPDSKVVRNIWMLLPYSNRQELMPSTFAWNNKLRFDIVVTTGDRTGNFAGYMTEVQAGGYPEGRYELSLQTAAEAEDQESLEVLWSRRSRREVWRLGFLLVAVLAILAVALRIMTPSPKP
ncbi:MAG TPA: hypothetical protein VGP68_11500 [Gemmataceae bacterium]|nr:hypothetical protein [Gemmataceae bacterium]